MIITPTHLGDRELGQAVPIPFFTQDPSSQAPASITGGTFRVIELGTKTPYTGVALTYEPNILSTTGLHRIVLDTSASFFRVGQDYIITATAGTVGGVSIVGGICGSFSIGSRSEGLLLRRVVKCHSGTVTIVGSPSTRRFRVDFTGIDTATQDFYRTQEINFQSGANSGIGRTILSYDADLKEILVQKPFPMPVELGATFVLIPHERELTIYTAHIEVEWGVGQAVGDRISIWILEDGEAMSDPGSVIASLTLKTWDFDTDAPIADDVLTPAANSGVYRYTSEVGAAVAPNAGLNILASFVIDGITHQFPRTEFNYH